MQNSVNVERSCGNNKNSSASQHRSKYPETLSEWEFEWSGDHSNSHSDKDRQADEVGASLHPGCEDLSDENEIIIQKALQAVCQIIASKFYKLPLNLITYNVKTKLDGIRLQTLEQQLNERTWHVVGISEVKLKGTKINIVTDSGNKFYYQEGDQYSAKTGKRICHGGVGFLVNKIIADNVIDFDKISNRVIHITLKVSEHVTIKLIQAYLPTTKYKTSDYTSTLKDIQTAIKCSSTTYFIVMGDFNAKVGKEIVESEFVGPYGIGDRNDRGQILVDSAERQKLFIMNTFFDNEIQNRWTWLHPNKVNKNEIDYFLANSKNIFKDVSVNTNININSDHRPLEALMSIPIIIGWISKLVMIIVLLIITMGILGNARVKFQKCQKNRDFSDINSDS